MLVGWLVAGLVQSMATVTFTGPPVFALIFGLVGVVAALSSAGNLRTESDELPDAAAGAKLDQAEARAVRR